MGWSQRVREAMDVKMLALAITVWLLCLAGLIFVPLVAASDPEVAVVWLPTWSFAWWMSLAVLSLQAGIILIAPRTPRWAVVLVALVPLPLAALVSWDAFSITAGATVVTVFLAVLAVEFSRVRLALLATTLLTTIGYVIAGLPGGDDSLVLLIMQALGQAIAMVVAPAGVASVLRSQREVRDARLREQDAVAREQEACVESAVARERTALARELHDIAAHHLSGIAVMAAAIERQIDGAPERAKDGAEAIRDQSRLVLEDLRRLVGLLRDNDGAQTPVYAVAAIKDLATGGPEDAEVRVFPSAGAEHGAGTELGAGIGPLGQLAGYRMVQEALANAVRHAPGSSRVVEIDDRDPKNLVLRVLNSPPSVMEPDTGSGFGLLGMQERAELVGASLRYGPTLEGGWEVQLCVPRDHTAHDRQQNGGTS